MQIIINVNSSFARKLAVLGVVCFAVAAAAVPVIVWATNTKVPHVFKNGDVADADQVNENFEALVAGIQANESGRAGLSERMAVIETETSELNDQYSDVVSRLSAVEMKQLLLENIPADIQTLQRRIIGLENLNTPGEIVFWAKNVKAWPVENADNPPYVYDVQFGPSNDDGIICFYGEVQSESLVFTTKEQGWLFLKWECEFSWPIDAIITIDGGPETALVLHGDGYRTLIRDITKGIHIAKVVVNPGYGLSHYITDSSLQLHVIPSR